MQSQQPIDILKEALLLERRGRAFYRQVASQAAHEAIADFFETMADEEQRHMEVITRQMQSVSQDKRWAELDPQDVATGGLSDLVLSDTVKSQIAGADFEAAAISAAMLMEEKAVALYQARAEGARDPAEKRLFQWLADWEKGHLGFLADLDRDIKTRLWTDNQFWPF